MIHSAFVPRTTGDKGWRAVEEGWAGYAASPPSIDDLPSPTPSSEYKSVGQGNGRKRREKDVGKMCT